MLATIPATSFIAARPATKLLRDRKESLCCLPGIRFRVRILRPWLEDELGLKARDNRTGLASPAVCAESVDVIGVAVGRDDGRQAAPSHTFLMWLAIFGMCRLGFAVLPGRPVVPKSMRTCRLSFSE